MSDRLDSIIEALPVSYYHYRLLLICGLAFGADAMEVSLLSFLATCAGDEWQLSYVAQATITGVVFFGELTGGIFWGPFADRFGRKKSFLLACSLIVIAGFLSGAAASYEWLIVFRGIVGFGVGGLTVPFDLLAEFLPTSRRGKFLMYIEYFWTFGSLFVAGIAWVGLGFLGWRGLAFITAIPVAVASVAALVYLPESPRWLMVKGRAQEAEAIIRDAAAVNGASHCVHSLCLTEDADLSTKSEKLEKEVSFSDLVGSARMRRISFPLWIIWTSFGFTYYGVILFIGRLYTQPSTGLGAGKTCTFDYRSIFINASAELVGVLIASIIVDEWGRTRTQSLLYALGGVAVLCMGLPLPIASLKIVSLVARLAAMGSSCATWVATPELYPTGMRATGHSVCSSLARVGAFAAPYFVVSSVSPFVVGLVLFAVNIIAAAVSGFLLPETNGVELHSGTGNGDAPISITPVGSSLHLHGLQANPNAERGETDSMMWATSLLHVDDDEVRMKGSI